MASEAGKGDSPRPKSVSNEEYARNYERIFGRKRSWWEERDARKTPSQVEKGTKQDCNS